MQHAVAQDDIAIDEVVTRGSLAARRIADGLSWGEGAIQPLAEHAHEQRALVEAVLENIEAVTDAEAAYSSCTDGRLPVRLASGEPVPVREQVVGADMVSAFFVAEVLGPRFYKDPAAPVASRVREVAGFLHDNELLPSSHIGCGAAGGFVTICENIVRFSQNPAYLARLQALLPGGVYDEALHAQLVAALTSLLEQQRYQGLDGQTFLDAVQTVGGDRTIAELKDDGRGVHGHVEEAIVRVRLDGQAINEAKVSAATGGREVFGVNDARLDHLARLFARGNDQDYRLARLALEDFASAGHGTLAKNLPTYIVTAA